MFTQSIQQTSPRPFLKCAGGKSKLLTQYIPYSNPKPFVKNKNSDMLNYGKMESLSEFIQSNPDPRELKRVLAVQMIMREYTYFEIRDVLQVSVGFISKWKQMFEEQSIAGLRLKHQGSSGYLDVVAQQEVIGWLQQTTFDYTRLGGRRRQEVQ